jgi:hypothetical protein
VNEAANPPSSSMITVIPGEVDRDRENTGSGG